MDTIPVSHHHSNHFRQVGTETDISLYSTWNNFFLGAGIPSSVANEYAVTFSQHRIRIDMLKEITKDILLDMGIKAMGDIIAILRHAKTLYTRDELKIGTRLTQPGIVTTASSAPVATITTTATATAKPKGNQVVAPRKIILNQSAPQRKSITTTRTDHATTKSIWSRLGKGSGDKKKVETTNGRSIGGGQAQLARPLKAGITKREAVRQQPVRLRSTVFNRLGEGPG